MSDASLPRLADLPPALAHRLNDVCNRFESRWRGGDRPRLDEFLPEPGDNLYPTLLAELVHLDVYYHRRNGESCRLEDYLSRYRALDPALLTDAFAAKSASAKPLPLELAISSGLRSSELGRYRIRRELGRGGFGIVFLADDARLRREVALKVARPEVLAQPELRRRFLREARATAGLDHPNVVPLYDSGEVDGVCYIASAYCPGDNLEVWLRRQERPVPSRRAAAILTALAGAVECAHQRGILHRDLKPANVLMVPTTEPTAGATADLGFIPRVTDFGLAKTADEGEQETKSGMLLGTPAYMAPEQAAGWSRQVGVGADLYALGVILYELLTGRTPSRGESLLRTLELVRSEEPVPPRRLRPDVPRDLEVICLRCLQKAPRDRYKSAGDLAADLERFLHGKPVRAKPVRPLERVWRWCRRRERLRDASLVAGFGGVICTFTIGWGIISILIGALPVASPFVALVYMTGILLLYGLSNLAVAVRTMARDVRAIWIGLLAPLGFLTCQTLVFFEILPTGGVVDFTRNPGAWQAQFATIWALGMFQSATFGLALLAYCANREQPDFR